MFRFFVQVEVRESVDEGGESEAKRADALSRIGAWLDSSSLMSPFASDRLTRGELVNTNGVDQVIAFGSRNAENNIVAQLHELFGLIAEVAPGSYGFAYYLDANHSRDWNVIVLKRGNVVVKEDPWFSPMVPEVEDAF